MKEVKWRTPTFMQFDSLHKTFNKQTHLISTGNVISDTQSSSFIRPFNETECNGRTDFEKGQLQDYDLKFFIETYRTPDYIISAVKELTKDKSTILYVFKHYIKGQRVIDGYVLTTSDYKEYKHLRTWYTPGANYKRRDAVEKAKEYICA